MSPLRGARPTLAAAALVAGFAVCYGSTVVDLAREWSRNDTYSHGFLVPWISLFLVWSRRAALRVAARVPAVLPGAALVLLGLAGKIVGHAANATVLEAVSMLPTIAGSVLLLAGGAVLRVLWLPIAYLAFMIPVWEMLTDRLHWPFQQFSAALGVGILGAIGVPSAREGILLHLPGITLQVAEVCSGVNYLLAVFAIGIPLAWLTFADWQRRLALLALGAIVAILANGVRIALIGVLLYTGISKDVHGPGHILQGLSVASAGYIALFAGAWAMLRFWRAPRARRAAVIEVTPTEGDESRYRYHRARAATSLAALLSIVGIWCVVGGTVSVPLHPGLDSLPMTIGGWTGATMNPGPSDSSPIRRIAATERIERLYTSSEGMTAAVHILYAENQRGGRDLIGYGTRGLVRGGEVAVFRPGANDRATVNRIRSVEGTVVSVTYAWYEVSGIAIASPARAKLATAWRALTTRTDNIGFVMIQAQYAEDTSQKRAATQVEQFVSDVEIALRKVFPSSRRDPT